MKIINGANLGCIVSSNGFFIRTSLIKDFEISGQDHKTDYQFLLLIKQLKLSNTIFGASIKYSNFKEKEAITHLNMKVIII